MITRAAASGAAVAIVLAGCGRIGFEPAGDGPAPEPCALTFTSLVMGERSTIGIDASGAAWGFGENDNFELLDVPPGPTPHALTAIPVGAKVAIGHGLAGFLDGSGTLYTWGLGNPPPTPKARTGGPWDQLAIGGTHGCVRAQSDHHLWCFGNTDLYAVGTNATGILYDPVELVGPGAVTTYDGAASGGCTIDDLSHLWCWGNDGNGNLGDGSGSAGSPTPILIDSAHAWANVTMSGRSTCAITTANALYCWGGYGYDGAPSDLTVPTLLDATRHWTDVHARADRTCGLADGNVWCWGNNPHGEVGLPGVPLDQRVAPVQVPLTTTVDELVVGATVACARATGGPWQCWGSDVDGALGLGDTALERAPFVRCPSP